MRVAARVLITGLVTLALGPPARAGKPPASQGPTVKDFLVGTFTEQAAAIDTRFDAEYRVALGLGLPDTAHNRATFLRAMFVYQLVKTGGILRNRFIIRQADGRHPDVMLKDAFAAAPLYTSVYSTRAKEWNGVRGQQGANIYSFGRCDEFEMLEASLMQKIFGLQARVAMVWSNHVVTQVNMEGGYLFLDSSFQQCVAFSARALKDAPPEDGVYSIERVNRIALRDLHETLRLDVAGAARVRAAIQSFLALTPPPPESLYCSGFAAYGFTDGGPKK